MLYNTFAKLPWTFERKLVISENVMLKLQVSADSLQMEADSPQIHLFFLKVDLLNLNIGSRQVDS